MIKIIRVTVYVVLVIYLVLAIGCGGAKAPEPVLEPTPPPPVKEPTVEDLRKPVAKDPDMFKVVKVMQRYGRLRKKAITFEKYSSLAGGQGGGAINPDWFCDTYILEMNENNYWVTFTLSTAKAAKMKDNRIQQVMSGLPEESISLTLKNPEGKRYILSDAEADGVLDYAAPANQATVKVDIPLLDKMQEKYTWLLGIVKDSYKNIKK